MAWEASTRRHHAGVPAYIRDNLRKVIECGTIALGAEVYASQTESKLVFHTCKSRFCTSCNLLDRLRVMATLQQWLWDEATIIADEILNGELGAVLAQAPDLALASSGEGEDLTEDDLDNFLDYCRRVVAIHHFRIHLDRPSGPIPEFPTE